MTWKPAELKHASVDELVDFALASVPTLRQMHAIEELAARATQQPALLPVAADAIAKHLGHASVMGGLPVGYLGAKVLFDQGGEARQALGRSLATVAPREREDLLRWLQPAASDPRATPPQHAYELELIFQSHVSRDALEQAIRSILGPAAAEMTIEVLPLAGNPAAMAMIGLPVHGRDELERQSARLSTLLHTTVYWFPAEELGALGPDLRVAVHQDGSRELVIARYTPDGFHVEPYPGAVEAP